MGDIVVEEELGSRESWTFACFTDSRPNEAVPAMRTTSGLKMRCYRLLAILWIESWSLSRLDCTVGMAKAFHASSYLR